MRDKFCGNLHDHEPHEWSRPANLSERLLGFDRFDFWCPGPPVIEGGSR